ASSECSATDPVCPDSRVCIFDPAPGPFSGAGSCMPEAFCDEAAAEGYAVPCTWSDGTTRQTGAPSDATECPPSPPAGTPFCGSPCLAGCQAYNAPNPLMPPHQYTANAPVCLGRSDRRQFGICGPADRCRRGVRAGSD